MIRRAATLERHRRASSPRPPAGGVDRSGLRHDGRSGQQARDDYRGETYYFCCAGCRTSSPPPREIPRAACAGTRRRRHDLHLPDASGNPQAARRLPDLRHGARAVDAHGRHRPEPRAGRYDAPLLDRPRAGAPGDGARDERAFRRALVYARRFAIGSNSPLPRPSCCGPAGRSSCAARSRSSRATSTCSR